ncbi:hypothetical protein MK851_04375 [Tenacibaculum sp. 1B UA]|uniref:DUF6588 family protein n=1 Tax=unclassified Tenacibaculum TaxID=2635139 RepID=UPI0026E39399|nr:MULTISPECIES: DUF6588 family protein [unclassified Tenacibaculum]MDO6675537.1 hypothetical protein [Tenacibaculum sp. 1_MG-2023]MDX8552862.1 hypothetical protein [Tenacibaculum sp. 1B UA]
MKKTLLPLLTLIISFSVKAQELETILLAKEDASKLTNAYLDPAMKGFIYSMNNGWYHTAKVHKKFGFDITIGANASFAPSKDEIFNISKLGLSQNTKVINNTFDTPTVLGSSSDNVTTAELEYTLRDDQGNEIGTANFTMPGGVKDDLPANAIPAPSVQVGLGLPFKFEAMLRYSPKVGSDDVKGGLFGIGVKKEITDWFGPMDKTPLHVSLLAAYTNMNVDYTIGDVDGDIEARNAVTEFRLNSYTVQAIASLNFPVINIYGGVGYNGGNTSLDMRGDSFYANYSTPLGTERENLGTNPLSLSSSSGSFNTTLGARLSLGFFKIFGSYTLQEYNSVNAGIAFSFR